MFTFARGAGLLQASERVGLPVRREGRGGRVVFDTVCRGFSFELNNLNETLIKTQIINLRHDCTWTRPRRKRSDQLFLIKET